MEARGNNDKRRREQKRKIFCERSCVKIFGIFKGFL